VNDFEVDPIMDNEVGGLEQNFSAISATLGWNRRSLINDLLYYKIGIAFSGIIPYGNSAILLNGEFSHEDYNTAPAKVRFQDKALKRTLNHNLFLFELGIGVLIF